MNSKPMSFLIDWPDEWRANNDANGRACEHEVIPGRLRLASA